MLELNALIQQRDELLDRIINIEKNDQGIDDENNVKRLRKLHLQQALLTAEKDAVSAQLVANTNEIASFSKSGTGIDRILAAIRKQQWYFFKNKPKILMDKSTGLIWANLYDFPWHSNDNKSYSADTAKKLVKNYDADGYKNWKIPSSDEFVEMAISKSFPFKDDILYVPNDNKNVAMYSFVQKSAYAHRFWFIDSCDYSIDLDDLPNKSKSCVSNAFVFPCNDILVPDSEYKKNVALDNPIYSEKERLQFTLDLFVKNELLPIFDDEEITDLYNKIYFEKPKLIEELKRLQTQIGNSQTVTSLSSDFNYTSHPETSLSSDFDYTSLLEKYDIQAINNSIIKYYTAIQQWTDELMDKLDYYEKTKEKVIRDFNLISLQLSKKYNHNTNLTDEENKMLEQRQIYFRNKFSLGMNEIKSKILSVKNQANDLEYRIDEIDNSENSITELAKLEKENRTSFSLITENTVKIIRNALQKIEYFETHHQFVINAISIWENWTENYRVFKTIYKEDLKSRCTEDGVEDNVWTSWYADWQKIRYNIELKVQPIIERGLKGEFAVEEDYNITVPEQIIAELKLYRDNIDKFFLEERKGIYQKFAFQSCGDLQDKIETESKLYNYTYAFHTALQKIIFNCKKSEDRVFILDWANSLLDIQIDEILSFVTDNDLQKISKTILKEFADLKQKNYDVYLTDAQAYGKEQAKREKQYNSLVFKMRKDLMK